MYDRGKILRAVLSELHWPIFCAAVDPRGTKLVLHVSGKCDAANLAVRARQVLSAVAASAVDVSISAHQVRQLAFPRSLEHWLNQFDSGDVIHDPTMVVTRARSLVASARICRSEFGRLINGLYFDPEQRTMIILHRPSGAANSQIMELSRRVAAIVNHQWNQPMAYTRHGIADHQSLNLQFVTDLPRRKLIPVDAKSGSLARRIGVRLRRWLTPGAIAIAAAAISVPAAANSNAGSNQIVRTSAHASKSYGILFGLSVFADGKRQYGPDVFTSRGLQLYFGERDGSAENATIVLTQNQRRRPREPAEIGQVGPGS